VGRTTGPFLEVARIQSEINHLFENLMDLEGSGGEGDTWVPNVDIVETDEELVVLVEVPGVDADGLRVTAARGHLNVEGNRLAPETAESSRAIVSERAYGRFRRSVHLEVPVNTRQARADLADGLLRLRFPKVPNRRGEVVAIEVNAR